MTNQTSDQVLWPISREFIGEEVSSAFASGIRTSTTVNAELNSNMKFSF
jgi:hypothetical protein